MTFRQPRPLRAPGLPNFPVGEKMVGTSTAGGTRPGQE